MGIVMCLMMMVSLLLIRPMSQFKINLLVAKASVFKALAILVLLAGCWNGLWYGLRHLNSFWGNAAIVSGAFMVLTAIIALYSQKYVKASTVQSLVWMKLVECVISAGLLTFLALYLVTIIRLNLGLSIL